MNVKAKVITMCTNVNLRFLVKLIYKMPDLFLEIVFYPESQSKQTSLRTELLMVKQPTCHVQCVDVFYASPCVFINCVQVCVWFTAGINNNHRAALSLIRQEQTHAYKHNRGLSARENKTSTSKEWDRDPSGMFVVATVASCHIHTLMGRWPSLSLPLCLIFTRSRSV